MASYAIGDIQGCFASFQQLLAEIDFDPGKDTLWLTGDLVNRGPESLQVLRWVHRHQSCVQIVLGNHDLHLLAVSEGVGRLHAADTLMEILEAADGKILLEWLRCQPLMIAGGGYAMVHAGLMPDWTIEHALDLAQEVEDMLSGPHYRTFLGRMYGNKPLRWNEDLRGMDRFRLIVNAMTRMRLLTRDGDMDLSFKGELDSAPAHLIPWYACERRLGTSMPIICGHWSAQGLMLSEDVLAIDTGCLWGGILTALRLDDMQVFAVPCQACLAIA